MHVIFKASGGGASGVAQQSLVASFGCFLFLYQIFQLGSHYLMAISMANLRPEDYCIAWVAPLEIEARAALHMLDHRHGGSFPMSRGDDYVFQAGDMCGHNIVIATLPAGQEYGTGSAAAIASQAKRFFPNFWFGLLVGVAAGIPDFRRSPPRDIRLGDVLVSIPDVDRPGAVAYDLGKETGKDELELLRQDHILAQTEPVVRSAIGSIKLESPDESRLFLPHYEAIKNKRHANGTFMDPGQEHDKLYQLDGEGVERLVERQPRPNSQRTSVWYGPIGSGEKLMKNAARRDQLRDQYGIIGLEMEAAGVMNRIPVGIIRGVCDYADEHKNKEWQPYAAAMAAAYAKTILSQIAPKNGSCVAPKGEGARKRSFRESLDSDEDDTRNKRCNLDEGAETSAGIRNVTFRGQGNQNVGSGNISIGGDQYFR
ncbi:purine and uridine phosphorylase [Hypoxylon sp. NC0597]|nr:purine and uridine phosphorylase [Hypoxylon sp. NC0597]